MKTLFLICPLLLMAVVGFQECVSTHSEAAAPPEVTQHNTTLYTSCAVRPSAQLAEGLPLVYGHVLFKEEYPRGTLQVLLRLDGFPRRNVPQLRAVHIHQYGDISKGCGSTGGHYNPLHVHHPNHPGDFGNFDTCGGRVDTVFDSDATLFGPLSVIGRAVVIHEKMDDMGQGGDAGSLLHGNAGPRLACCVIGISSPKLWNACHDAELESLSQPQ